MNRRHWQRCRTKVEPGQVRCEDCELLLCQHSDVEVRRIFSGEQALARQVLEILISDPDMFVSGNAHTALRVDVPDGDEELVAESAQVDEGGTEW